MTGWDMKVITADVRSLIKQAADDPSLRDELRALAREILAATEASQPHSPATASAPETTAPAVKSNQAPPLANVASKLTIGTGSSTAPPKDSGAQREPLRELTLGRRPSPPVLPLSAAGGSGQVGSDKSVLDEIEARCRAKSDVARWAAESQRRLWEGVESPLEDAPTDPEMVAWADRMVNSFYWLDDQDGSLTVDLSLLDELAGCFETVAEAVGLIASGEGRRGAIERALPLLAEAQSMLRAALRRLQVSDDPDQLAVYEWVRESAARHRLYIKRYMRSDDMADPAGWPELLSRIEGIAASGQQSVHQKARIDRLRDLLKPVVERRGTDEAWRSIVDAVEHMVGEGVPPSNREVRDLLLPVIDELPERDDLPPGFRRVLREIDRFLATRTTSPKAAAAQAPATEVKEAARLLSGRSAVLIGGVRRREAQASLTRSLGLKELIWIETKEHQSIDAFEPIIARADVALVLLAIRWSSHAFGDVRQFCVQHGKRLVRLPGGYGPNQVAAQILSQCSDWLGGG